MSEQEKTEKPFDVFVEHQKKAAEEAAKAVEALLPPEFREHGKAAINESIEGFRVLFNSLLDDIKTEVNKAGDDADTPTAGTGKNKVKVDLT